MPYGPPRHPTAPPPRRSRRSGPLVALLVVIVFLITGALVRNAISTGKDDASAGPQPSHTFAADGETGPAEAANNPLLTDPEATLIPADCDYAPWGTKVETARAFFESAAGCLADAWKPLLEKSNLPFQEPLVNVSASASGISTPCTGSGSDFAAFYCPANKTIYMPISQLQTELFKDNWIVYLSVFAHEYGHHVQGMSGILRRVNGERLDAGPRTPKGLELSRRIELQANCFDGMYLTSSEDGGSLTSSQITLSKRDARGRGDQPGDMRDHGTTEHGGDWFELGLEHNRTAQCNTFTAPAEDVS